MAATGLSADPKEYRARLADQSDDQIDAWAAELMRDVVDPPRHRQGRRRLPARGPARRSRIRTGVRFRRRAAGVIGRDAAGPPDGPDDHAVRPRAGIRAQVPDGRERLIEYLVENFDELVYV